MAAHVFYPSPELPNQVISYAAGLQQNQPQFGTVVGNSAAELTPIVNLAQQLVPKADEIEQLQKQLATKLEAYHQAAAPLWSQFSEKLGYARTFAEKHHNAHLDTFLLAFRHNEGRHAAKVAAQGGSATTAKS